MKPSANRGNTVDLAPVRAKVAKVKQSKKARQAARRRLALERAAAAAAAAEAARAAALRCWDTEEKRLESLPNRPEPSGRRVQFSQTCTVTEIPIVHAHDLPDPVISEARLEDGPREMEEEESDELNSPSASGVPFNSLELSNEDEMDDDDYLEEMDSEEASDSDESDPATLTNSEKPVVDSDQPSKSDNESDGDSTETDTKATRMNPPRIARIGALELIQSEAKFEEESETSNAEPNAQVIPNGKKKDKKKRRRHSFDVCTTSSSNGVTEKESEAPKGKKKRKRRSLSPQGNKEIQEVEKKSNDCIEEDKKKKKTNAKSEFSNGQDKNLEDIFSNYSKNKKRKRESTNTESPKAMKMKNSQGTGSIGARPARYTNEGYRIYTEEEIAADQPAGLGKLNGPCPFDCSCCY